MGQQDNLRVPTPAAWLGGLGAVPFVLLAAATWLGGPTATLAHVALLGYGAVILSFLGGVHWGLAMPRDPGWSLLTLSVLPSLVAWVGLLLPGRAAYWVLAAAIVAMLLVDLALARRGLTPAWYPRLRVPLSLVVTASLVAGALTR